MSAYLQQLFAAVEQYSLIKKGHLVRFSLRSNRQQLVKDFPFTPECHYCICAIDMLLEAYPTAEYEGLQKTKKDTVITITLKK